MRRQNNQFVTLRPAPLNYELGTESAVDLPIQTLKLNEGKEPGAGEPHSTKRDIYVLRWVRWTTQLRDFVKPTDELGPVKPMMHSKHVREDLLNFRRYRRVFCLAEARVLFPATSFSSL